MTGEEAKERDHTWSDGIIVYDEGNDGTSFIWGRYRDNPNCTLGIRWNISEGQYVLGFPHAGPNPCWLVMPDVIVRSSLLELLARTARMDITDRQIYQPRIVAAIQKWEEQQYDTHA